MDERGDSSFSEQPTAALSRTAESAGLVGENAFELAVNLFVMVLVERVHGQTGIGIYSYLLAVFSVAGYVSLFGIDSYVEREMATRTGDRVGQARLAGDALRAALTMGWLCAALFAVTAGYDTTHTHVDERLASYLIIGLALPLHNVNALRFSLLHGHGHHGLVARLRLAKRSAFLFLALVLLAARLPPSYLPAAFLGCELLVFPMARKQARIPSRRGSLFANLRAMLREGSRYVLVERFLDLVFYVDLLVLGLFRPTWEIGAYAEATVLARFFLLIPTSLQPVFRHRYCVLTGGGRAAEAAALYRNITKILYCAHALIFLYALRYFPDLLRFVFETPGEERLSFQVFTLLVPGLIFFAAVVGSEPLYEAFDAVAAMRRLAVGLVGVNLALNFYLVPFAGVFGSATATMVSMLLYFFVFGRGLPATCGIDKGGYLLAGASIYLTDVVTRHLDIGVSLGAVVPALLLAALLFVTGFVRVEPVPANRR